MRTTLAIGSMLLAVASLAQEAPTQLIAVIDVDQLVQESAAGKEALGRLQKLRDEKVAEGKKMNADLEALQQQLSAQRSTLSDQKISDMQKQIEDKQIALKRFQDDSQQQLQDAQEKEYAKLNEQIMPIITEMGKDRKYMLILNKYRSGLLYADDSIDITDEVLRRFNTKVTK
jgi:outer membrane protein